jgi:tRNA-2-methylthio-N6-dimethylallyladenosine synthase
VIKSEVRSLLRYVGRTLAINPWKPVKRVSEGTYYIETYGCQMNDHDSEKMAAMLEGLGLTEASSPDEAEVVVINTCSIREKAEQNCTAHWED